MRKAITSIMTLVAMLFATSAMAQFKGSVTQYPTTDYSMDAISFSLNEVATALGTDTATLISAYAEFAELPQEDFYVAPGTSTFYVTLSTDEESTRYTQGGNGNYWLTSEGKATVWGSTEEDLVAAWYYELDMDPEEELLYFWAGQMPDACKAEDVCHALVTFHYGEATATFDLTLNIEAKPTIDVEPCTTFSKLQIVGRASTSLSQYPRANWAYDPISFDVAGIAEALGMSTDNLSMFFEDMLYAKTYDADYDIITDSLTHSFTATPNPGFWYIKTYDENTGDEGDEVVQGPYGGEDVFWVSSIAFDAEAGTITAEVGQYPNGLAVNQSRYGCFYVIYGDKAYELKVELTIIPEPAKPYKEMEKVGEENYEFELDHDFNDYGISYLEFNLDSIAELLGCDPADIKLQFLKDEENFSSSSTANNGGCWLNEDGFVCSWSTTARTYFEPTTSGDFSELLFGSYQPGWGSVLEDSVIYKGSAFLVGNNKYYQVNGSFWRKGENVDPQSYTVETCATVATQVYTYQIVPNGNDYQDDHMINEPLDLNIDFIKAQLGGTETLYGEVFDSVGNVTYSKAYSCDPKPGFWMIASADNVEHKSMVGTWGTNTYGMSYANGIMQFFQFPGQRAVGDYYTDNFYLVNLQNGKKIKYVVTVNFVEEYTEMSEVVGSETLTLGARDGESEFGIYTEVDLAPMYEALGCSAEEFAEAGKWLAMNKDGQFAEDNYDEQEGFFFAADGKTIDDGTEVVHCGFAPDEEKFYSWIIDDQNLVNAYNMTIYAEYNSQWYAYYITVGTPEVVGINAVKNNVSKSGKVFDLTGREVKNPSKGIYIQNGKKVLFK